MVAHAQLHILKRELLVGNHVEGHRLVALSGAPGIIAVGVGLISAEEAPHAGVASASG